MALEKSITIDGKEVRFRASAVTPVIYSTLFPNRDFFRDLMTLENLNEKIDSGDAEDEGSAESASEPVQNFTAAEYSVFMRMMYTYAYQALNTSPFMNQAQREFRDRFPDEWTWLDSFSQFSMLQIFPQMLELWGMNAKELAKAKNRQPAPPEK